MTTNLQAATTLSNGVRMPWLGLGAYQIQDVNAIKTAIKLGYRSIDTATAYQNERAVGQAIRESIEEGVVRREDLFVTSKVWINELSYDATLAAFHTSLKKLGLSHLDLYLVHWPVKGRYKEAWRALETLYKQGKVRAIGVSNFQVRHLQDLMDGAEIKPTINQVEFHPLLTQKELLTFCQEQGIQLEAWSPLMMGQLTGYPVLEEIATSHSKTIAQVILRWDLQHGVVTIPKSTKEVRIAENMDIFDFELSEDDMVQIDKLNRNQRLGPDPDNF